MRISLLACVAASLVGLSGLATASSAAPNGDLRSAVTQHGIVEQAQYSRYCARLRRACEYKHQRGEEGEGNCRRYRRECR
jgi:hypothetical protein